VRKPAKVTEHFCALLERKNGMKRRHETGKYWPSDKNGRFMEKRPRHILKVKIFQEGVVHYAPVENNPQLERGEKKYQIGQKAGSKRGGPPPSLRLEEEEKF